MNNCLKYSIFGQDLSSNGGAYKGMNYPFSFNGKEKDKEIYGEGNALSFKYRVHDSRLGRFLSVDPLYRDYPWNSTYAFAENSPIRYVDLEGLEKAEPEAFQAAQANIEYATANGGQSTYFPNITREEFGKQLTNLVSNPESPDLQEWFCGPTALAYTYLNYNPIAFVTAAFELYDKGTVTIPGGGTIDASHHANVTSSNQYAVFQMFATSLRASQNGSNLTTSFNQATRPSNFIGMVGLLGLKVDNGGFGKEENIDEINKAQGQGKFTILLENYQVSHGYPYGGIYTSVGVHYITITSSIAVHGQNMSFEWWDHRESHPTELFNTYEGTISNFREGVKGWWTISK